MNTKKYKQLEIPLKNLIWEKNFLKEEIITSIIKYKNKILKINLPNKINLKVLYTEKAIKGNTNYNVTKKAILKTGLELQVPLFIKKMIFSLLQLIMENILNVFNFINK